jgi:hypothetical protein
MVTLDEAILAEVQRMPEWAPVSDLAGAILYDYPDMKVSYQSVKNHVHALAKAGKLDYLPSNRGHVRRHPVPAGRESGRDSVLSSQHHSDNPIPHGRPDSQQAAKEAT